MVERESSFASAVEQATSPVVDAAASTAPEESTESQAQDETPKPRGIYFGQLLAVTGFWSGAALLPWLSGNPEPMFGAVPAGLYATVALPFSLYFATVANPQVPITSRPYGLERIDQDGKRTVYGLAQIHRRMTAEEEEALRAGNAAAQLKRLARLELERSQRREMRALRKLERATRRKQSLMARLSELEQRR